MKQRNKSSLHWLIVIARMSAVAIAAQGQHRQPWLLKTKPPQTLFIGLPYRIRGTSPSVFKSASPLPHAPKALGFSALSVFYVTGWLMG